MRIQKMNKMGRKERVVHEFLKAHNWLYYLPYHYTTDIQFSPDHDPYNPKTKVYPTFVRRYCPICDRVENILCHNPITWSEIKDEEEKEKLRKVVFKMGLRNE
jgi:hypothetical protein